MLTYSLSMLMFSSTSSSPIASPFSFKVYFSALIFFCLIGIMCWEGVFCLLIALATVIFFKTIVSLIMFELYAMVLSSSFLVWFGFIFFHHIEYNVGIV